MQLRQALVLLLAACVVCCHAYRSSEGEQQQRKLKLLICMISSCTPRLFSISHASHALNSCVKNGLILLPSDSRCSFFIPTAACPQPPLTLPCPCCTHTGYEEEEEYKGGYKGDEYKEKEYDDEEYKRYNYNYKKRDNPPDYKPYQEGPPGYNPKAYENYEYDRCVCRLGCGAACGSAGARLVLCQHQQAGGRRHSLRHAVHLADLYLICRYGPPPPSYGYEGYGGYEREGYEGSEGYGDGDYKDGYYSPGPGGVPNLPCKDPHKWPYAWWNAGLLCVDPESGERLPNPNSCLPALMRQTRLAKC
jgi:hypothetical protein